MGLQKRLFGYLIVKISQDHLVSLRCTVLRRHQLKFQRCDVIALLERLVVCRSSKFTTEQQNETRLSRSWLNCNLFRKWWMGMQGRRKVSKSGGAGSSVVGIISPTSLGLDRVNWSAKIWGCLAPPAPTSLVCLVLIHYFRISCHLISPF